VEYTREPIIETIITPREGYKLIVRSSKGKAEEEFSVDAVEIVSFGGSALFFRSQERPKSFLLPVSDYEVLELRETRAVLKAPVPEKSIKIGGQKEQGLKKEPEETPPLSPPEVSEEDKRRERRKMKKQKHHERKNEKAKTVEAKETKTSQATISRLLPPPPSLISETLTRFKQAPMGDQQVTTEVSEEVPLPQGITPEESEVEREQPIIPELKQEELTPLDTQVPYESATPDSLPTQTQKDLEDDEPSVTKEEKANFTQEER
jgi:hypothetical protein